MNTNYQVTNIEYETTRRGVNASAVLRAKDGRYVASIEDIWYECGGSKLSFVHTDDWLNFIKEARLAGFRGDSDYGRFLLEGTEKQMKQSTEENDSGMKKTQSKKISGWNDARKIASDKNSTEEMLLKAVEANGIVIANIENPSEAVQIAAVSTHGRAIFTIKNPTESACLASVRHSVKSIAFIKNPSVAVQVEALCYGMRQGEVNMSLLVNKKTMHKFDDAALDTVKPGLANQRALVKTLASTPAEYEALLLDWMTQTQTLAVDIEALKEVVFE